MTDNLDKKPSKSEEDAAWGEIFSTFNKAIGDRETTLYEKAFAHFQAGELEKAEELFKQLITITRNMGDASGEALYLLDLALTYQGMKRFDDAVQFATAGRDVMVQHNLAKNASGMPVSIYDMRINQLKREQHGDKLSDAEKAHYNAYMLVELYRQSGPNAIRNALKGQVSDSVIERIIADLARKQKKVGKRPFWKRLFGG